MKTQFASAQHCATPLPARSTFLDLQAAANRRRGTAYRAPTPIEVAHLMPAFSPLVQEFLDECGYSDK